MVDIMKLKKEQRCREYSERHTWLEADEMTEDNSGNKYGAVIKKHKAVQTGQPK